MTAAVEQRHRDAATAIIRAWQKSDARPIAELIEEALADAEQRGVESAKAEAQPTLDQLAKTIRDLAPAQREWLLEPHRRSLREALTASDQLRKAEAQPAGTGWVSVEERLPATAEAVLVVNNGQRGLAWHSAMGWYSYRDALLTGVTHWQPLPPPPEPR